MIGPELPPHLLAKRQQRRTQERPSGNSEPGVETTSKIGRIGPSRPPTGIPVGSQLPPSFAKDDDEVSIGPTIGPAMPPLLESRNSTPSPPAEGIVGPQLPAGLLRGPAACEGVNELEQLAHESSDEDDDLVGPRAPSASEKALLADPRYQLDLRKLEVEERMLRAEEARSEAESAKSKEASQRGEWMLVPPSAKPIAGIPGRSRQFAKRDADYTLDKRWTETPQERAERLTKGGRTSVVGSKKRAKDDGPRELSTAEKNTAKAIADYNSQYRPQSLVASYQKDEKAKKRRTDGAGNDPGGDLRPFDRERDILGARPVDSRKRSEIIRQAGELNSRFSHGKSAFL